MGQLVNVLLAIEKAHTLLYRALDCGPDFGGLNQAYGPNHPTTSVYSICGKYTNIFIRCTNRNQFDIQMTAVAYVRNDEWCF